MADFTITSCADQFPVGTSVGAYALKYRRDGGSPLGTATATAIVAAAGSLAFEGLDDDTAYTAYASVGGVHRYRNFSTDRPTYTSIDVTGPLEDGQAPTWSTTAGRFVSEDPAWINAKRFGIRDGFSDSVIRDRLEDAIEAAASAGVGVVLPYNADGWPIDGPVDITAEGARFKALGALEQTGDILGAVRILYGANGAQVSLREATNSGTRFDAADDSAYQWAVRKATTCAAVLVGADNCDVTVGKAEGFYAGIALYALASGNITQRTEGTRATGNTVRLGYFTGGDMGVLVSGQQDPKVFARGNYALSTNCVHAPHLLYVVADRSSRGGEFLVMANGSTIQGVDVTVAHAAQFKNITGATARVVATATHGALSIGYGSQIDAKVVGRQLTGIGSGAVSFDLTTSSPTFCNVDAYLQFEAAQSDSRAVLCDGADNTVKAVVDVDMDDASSDYYTVCRGGSTLDVAIRNAGTGGRRGARVQSGTGNRLVVREMRNVPYGFVVDSGATDAEVHVADPSKIVPNASGRAGIVSESTARVYREPLRGSYTISGAGSTNVDTGKFTTIELDVTTTSAFTVTTTTTDCVDGERLVIELQNNSGGALGSRTWTNFTVNADGTPGNGEATILTFERRAGTWTQLGGAFKVAAPQTYSVTNVSTDRGYDADSTSTAELADVLGTLIADLRAQGIVS